MNWAIVKNTWQMCLASKLRQIVVAFLILFPLIKSTAQLCIENRFPHEFLSEPGGSIPFVLACGSGCIGGQLNDGTLSLVLSRPLKISSYVLSKWLAVAIASTIASLTQYFAELIVVGFRTAHLLDVGTVLTNGIERILICFGFSAVFMFFSSLVSSSKDLAVYFVCFLTSELCGMLAQIRPETLPEGAGRIAATVLVPPVAFISDILHFVLAPNIALLPLVNHFAISWTSITAYLSVVAIFTALCVFSLNRRELPYGAD